MYRDKPRSKMDARLERIFLDDENIAQRRAKLIQQMERERSLRKVLTNAARK